MEAELQKSFSHLSTIVRIAARSTTSTFMFMLLVHLIVPGKHARLGGGAAPSRIMLGMSCRGER